MNTIETTKKLKQALVDYLATTFDVNKDGKESDLAYEIKSSFERPGALFHGPFLELIFPYKTDLSIRDLCNSEVFSTQIMDLSCFKSAKPEPIALDAPLYTHQVKAIHKICVDKKSVVVSAGTGSGKTECFSLPIINDLLSENTTGVRALLIYPLNALVNDQLDRLRVLLKDTNITFGRFTGELPDEAKRDSNTLPNEIISRNEIREQKRIPQVLITNYAMLEYLLLRPEDSIIFQGDHWKYLVLDEAHTYSGAKGIEVAMLVRRLKERLSKKSGELICIATSATLINDDADKAAEFARNLFGENFDLDDIIFGEPNTNHLDFYQETYSEISSEAYIHHSFDALIDEIRSTNPNVENIALLMNEIGLIKDEDLGIAEKYDGDINGFLHRILISNPDIKRLRDWMIDMGDPVTAIDAANYLFPNMDRTGSLQALYHLVELGAIARPGKNKLSLLPAKYHLFARPPQGIWVCINPNCIENQGKDQGDRKWSKVFSIPHEYCDVCGATVYPIYLCRQCGQSFIATDKKNNQYHPASELLMEDTAKRYFTWRLIEENLALSDDEIEDDIDEIFRWRFHQKEYIICLHCRNEKALCRCDKPIYSIPLYNIQIEEKKIGKKNNVARRWRPVESLHECPRCGSSSKGETEIVTPVSLSGTSPLANLTYELYRQLPPSTEKSMLKYPGGGRKLLTFYDSRQGAARFAAYLQDVANKQNYRHIVPKVIDRYIEQKGYWPSLNGLIENCVEMALENKIIQNDPDVEGFWRKNVKSYSREEKDEAKKWVAAQILGEITTGSRQRQSLESLGLVGINYFEEDYHLDFSDLLDHVGINKQQILILIGYLLDDLRYQKAIILPFNIERDDPVFGPHKGNPSIIRQGATMPGEIRWIGATSRQRRRQYIRMVLERNDLDYSDESIENTLNNIWDWLLETTDVLGGSVETGYKLNTSRWFFNTNFQWYRCNKCQRISYRGTSLPCPHPHCGGDISPIDIFSQQNNNYYFNLFKERLIPVRVEEHTAQLDPEKGREYQDNFKKGVINVLSCSTTFELGINLGDLQSVAMSNVPPTVANYRQRSGRAGRRTGGTAYILTWASGRPHDQAYYSNPSEIINGEVAVPHLLLDNDFILQRHINAILLSLFLRYRKGQGETSLKFCGDFFDRHYQQDPQYTFISDWVRQQKEVIDNSLTRFRDLLNYKKMNVDQNWVNRFLSDLEKVNREHYQPITKFYIDQIELLADKSKDISMSSAQYNENDQTQKHFRKLLDRLRGERLIEYLSNKGVLPSYSFPLHTVELLLPKEARASEHLKLERDLIQAIREYAPGSEIVADKRVWKSLKPVFWKDAVRDWAYRICNNCHHLEVGDDAGIPLPNEYTCPICDQPYNKKQKIFVVPDGFVADKKSGKPAKQYVNIEPNQMRSALLPIKNIDEQQISDLINVAYERAGKLLYVNEGKLGIGFKFSLHGFDLDNEINKKGKRFSLGHIQTTDTLHIRFHGSEIVKVPSPSDNSFWLSLMYALIHGASHALQIERRDIDGVLSPRKTGAQWEQTIVLYDNVPGGAGHVKIIRDRIMDVIKDAIRVLNCNDCSPKTSCQHCLRDYNNQLYHDQLVRENSLAFLEVVLADLEPLIGEVEGASKVITTNPSMWLLRKIENAQLSVDIVVPNLGLGHPLGENYTWFDTMNNLLLRNCEVNVYVQQLPNQDSVGLSVSKQIQVLMDKGLRIWKVHNIPQWQILTDRSSESNSRAIRSYTNEHIVLGNDIGTKSLLSTISKGGVVSVHNELTNLRKIAVNAYQFDPPQNVSVINLYSSAKQYVSIPELFGSVLSKPCLTILINDPYLIDKKSINLLEPYLELASKTNSLKSVIVHTNKSINFEEQLEAEKLLNDKFNNVIVFKHTPIEHDRYIELNRENGEKARIILGRGFDFMQSDGSIKSTFIIIQDPVSS
jgi:ATP-dependent helicase YprA (DUF1998 family)